MSSVDVRQKDNGQWEIRWREDGRRRGRTVSRERDAQRFADGVRRRLELGGVVQLDQEVPTLNEWVPVYWELYAVPKLSANTRRNYKRVWGKHVRPRIGHLRLRAINTGVIDTELVEPMRREMAASPAKGDPTILMALALLSGVMRLAVKHGHIPVNPVDAVTKPEQKAPDTEPLWPTTIELLRAKMALRDKTIVSLIAYAGLRPEEVLALEWRDIRDDGIVVERAVALGEVKATKSPRSDRVVALLSPLGKDLAEWRIACGMPRGRDLLFPRRDGSEWREHDYRNWRRRVFQKRAMDLGLAVRRPYDLRVSFASLLIQEGRTVVEVAEQLGNSPETCLRHYAKLFRDAPKDKVPAETAIRQARGEKKTRRAG